MQITSFPLPNTSPCRVVACPAEWCLVAQPRPPKSILRPGERVLPIKNEHGVTYCLDFSERFEYL